MNELQLSWQGYQDYGFHLKVALPALPLMALPAMIVAFFVRSKVAVQ